MKKKLVLKSIVTAIISAIISHFIFGLDMNLFDLIYFGGFVTFMSYYIYMIYD
jgi:hypothetical protein